MTMVTRIVEGFGKLLGCGSAVAVVVLLVEVWEEWEGGGLVTLLGVRDLFGGVGTVVVGRSLG